jgi:hypothetical protein
MELFCADSIHIIPQQTKPTTPIQFFSFKIQPYHSKINHIPLSQCVRYFTFTLGFVDLSDFIVATERAVD